MKHMRAGRELTAGRCQGGRGFEMLFAGALSTRQGFTASSDMLFTPNFLLAPWALSEMNWY
jgi:hypothetical protein